MWLLAETKSNQFFKSSEKTGYKGSGSVTRAQGFRV